MIIALVLAYVVTFGLIGPVFFMAESYWTTNPRTNTSYVTYQLTQWYMDNKDALDTYRSVKRGGGGTGRISRQGWRLSDYFDHRELWQGRGELSMCKTKEVFSVDYRRG